MRALRARRASEVQPSKGSLGARPWPTLERGSALQPWAAATSSCFSTSRLRSREASLRGLRWSRTRARRSRRTLVACSSVAGSAS
eukprot:9248504-Alexandrium_andersonii.AAC.1